MQQKYQPSQFEEKWVEEWEKNKIYKTPSLKSKVKSQKSFIFPMFPYPSGAGLHVGHVRVYTGTDVIARFHRMNGYAVLHPMGWDAFGLPAENAAIKAKKNPMDMVPAHIATFRKQMKSLGFSYDWEREFSTTDPQYYKWTQWLFLQFYKMGLLYKKNTPINFCPSCKTGLAEEEVLSDGTHERCGTKITKKELPQWLFRITQYADRLLADLEGLDWPKGILEMQRNWIGRSEGARIEFEIHPAKGGTKFKIEVFTTALDTIYGATFMVLSPEHPFVKNIKNQKVQEYVKKSQLKSDIKKESANRDKTGVFTGFYCINPFNNKPIPIWVADYVLMSYGTGAVMGVPGHDARDHQFAKKHNLKIEPVIRTTLDAAVAKVAKVAKDGFWNYEEIKTKYARQSELFNSGEFSGMASVEGKEAMMKYIEKKGLGKRAVTYHLRDWIFSRQRYWGEPIPMIFCANCAKNQISNFKFQISNSNMAGWYPVPEDQLPVTLPYVKSYQPTGTGESPLAKIKDWVNVACPECGGPARRETDTMPNWAGSCWYFIAFTFWNQEARHRIFSTASPPLSGGSPKPLSQKQVSSPPSMNNWQSAINNFGYWLPADWYIGGAEHAVLHLLYARFWVKALYDLKLLHFKEPFTRLRNLGMILAEDHRKMSKSLGNIVNPDDVMKEYGADALRVYEMFMAPFDQEVAWSTRALQGAYRFVKRVWEIYQNFKFQISNFKFKEDRKLVAKLQKTIAKVTKDITDVKFNTAIAAMMEFLNTWEEAIKKSEIRNPKLETNSNVQNPNDQNSFGNSNLENSKIVSNFDIRASNLVLNQHNAKKFLQILAPFAPFLTEEIWHEVFGEKESIHLSSWPKVEGKIVEKEVVIPVQVNGKLRATIKVPTTDLSATAVVNRSLKEEKVKKYLEGKKYKVIYVEGKILNFVVKDLNFVVKE